MEKTKLKDLPPELIEKMKGWEANKPEYKTVRSLEDITTMVQEISTNIDDRFKNSKDYDKDLSAVLLDIRESLGVIKNKKAKDVPNYAKPVLEGFRTLEKALTASIDKIDMNPSYKPEIHVASPEVIVKDTKIDTKGLEKIVSSIPTAFDKAVKGIPKVDIPKTDFSPLVNLLSELSEKLDSIDTATRMKPQSPSSIRVNNLSEILPIDENPDIHLTYTGGLVTGISKTEDSITKSLTLSYDVNGQITDVTRWSEI